GGFDAAERHFRGRREARAGDRHFGAAFGRALLRFHLLDRRLFELALLARFRFVAPDLLVPVEVAVDHLVVLGAVDFAEFVAVFRGRAFAAAQVGDLVFPGVVPGFERRVGHALAVLVDDAARERFVGGIAVRPVLFVAAAEAGGVRDVGVDDQPAPREFHVAVVGAVLAAFGPQRAGLAFPVGAALDFFRRDQEVHVFQILG